MFFSGINAPKIPNILTFFRCFNLEKAVAKWSLYYLPKGNFFFGGKIFLIIRVGEIK